MSLKTKIVGVDNLAAETQENVFGSGLKVYTYKGVLKEDSFRQFTNPTQGSNLNVNAAVSGTPEQIHNGIDSVLWTASALSGTWVFDSTAQANTGIRSIDATATTNNDTALISKGSNLDMRGYSALTGFIYITNWSPSGTKDVRLQWRNSGTTSGLLIDLSTYIDTTSFNTWQKFTIPLSDFGAASSAIINELTITTVDVGPGPPPDYYLDDIQLEEVGGGFIYTISPELDEFWDVTSISFTIVDAFNSTLLNSSMFNLPYNGLLSLATLTNGINIQRIQDGEIKYSTTIRDFIDFMDIPAQTELDAGGDGVNTWFSLKKVFPTAFRLVGQNADTIKITVNDDLSSLIRFRAYCDIKEYSDYGS